MGNMNTNHQFHIGCHLIKVLDYMMLHGEVHLVEIFILIAVHMDVLTYQQDLLEAYIHKFMLIYQLLFIDKIKKLNDYSYQLSFLLFYNNVLSLWTTISFNYIIVNSLSFF